MDVNAGQLFPLFAGGTMLVIIVGAIVICEIIWRVDAWKHERRKRKP